MKFLFFTILISSFAFAAALDKEAVRKVVQTNLKEIKGCYELGLDKNSKLNGLIVIEWTFNHEGKVTDAKLTKDTLKDEEVSKCAVTKLKSWNFPKLAKNEKATIRFPFVLQANDQSTKNIEGYNPKEDNTLDK